MSQPLAATATRAPALRDHHTDHTHQGDRDREAARRTRLWTMIEALAYAGAFIDPSGILAVQRLRQAQEEEERNGRR
ncbi:MAG TPA: hypothetical protein VK713_06965 [Actinomycetes bacterium]|jgi:hypothetical protein|nr:hypothetical protein [Actinomycetes bacterium]